MALNIKLIIAKKRTLQNKTNIELKHLVYTHIITKKWLILWYVSVKKVNKINKSNGLSIWKS